MARVIFVVLIAVLMVELMSVQGGRMRRGFNNSGYGTSTYGRGSDERDASVSQENISGCGGNDRSGSRELAYNKDGRQSNEHIRGGRSFTRSAASASASATAFSQNKKNNNV